MVPPLIDAKLDLAMGTGITPIIADPMVSHSSSWLIWHAPGEYPPSGVSYQHCPMVPGMEEVISHLCRDLAAKQCIMSILSLRKTNLITSKIKEKLWKNMDIDTITEMSEKRTIPLGFSENP